MCGVFFALKTLPNTVYKYLYKKALYFEGLDSLTNPALRVLATNAPFFVRLC